MPSYRLQDTYGDDIEIWAPQDPRTLVGELPEALMTFTLEATPDYPFKQVVMSLDVKKMKQLRKFLKKAINHMEEGPQ